MEPLHAVDRAEKWLAGWSWLTAEAALDAVEVSVVDRRFGVVAPLDRIADFAANLFSFASARCRVCASSSSLDADPIRLLQVVHQGVDAGLGTGGKAVHRVAHQALHQ